MSSTNVATRAPRSDAPASTPAWVRRLAVASGLLGFLLFIAVPFLPVTQTQSELSWPQQNTLRSVNAPLMSYVPERFEATVPLAAIPRLENDDSLILGTLPPSSSKSAERGLFVRSFDGGLDVTVRGDLLFELTPAEVRDLPKEAAVTITATPEGVSATISNAPDAADFAKPVAPASPGKADEADEDSRPMLTGIYTQLPEDASLPGLTAHVDIDSRFSTTPTPLKYAAMAGGLALALISLWALRKIDGPARTPLIPRHRLRPTWLDAIVVAILGYWHFFGANTADDGYILTMARASEHSGYMSNYYRWLGVPEAPFGWPYYDLLALMTNVTTASTFMRLPSLIAGFVTWWTLSRILLPYLGPKVADRPLALWTAASIFLCFWMPYNNGIRPEPIIAMGAIVAWACFERAIETRRLFPAALGVLTAALSLAAGPTGLMAVAALLASLPPLLRILTDHIPTRGLLPQVAPILAAGTLILVGVFGTQTFAAVLESTRVRSEIGPALPWHQEIARWQSLFSALSVDGSFTRRFPMLMFLVALGIVLTTLLRHTRIPGIATGPTIRLVLIVLGTFFFLMFTPTKWTHHFGTNAGTAAALCAIAAIIISRVVLRSRRAALLTTGGFGLIFALALAGNNGWWYVASFAIPWWDRPIQYQAIEANVVVLYASIAILAVGICWATPKATSSRLIAAPMTVLSVLVAVFSMANFAKSTADQDPAYSIARGNLRDITGNTCAMANDVLVETDTNNAFLTPAGNIPLGDSLDTGDNRGFDPNGMNALTASGSDALTNTHSGTDRTPTSANFQASISSTEDKDETTPDQDKTTPDPEPEGPNGSTYELPFNLDGATVPVLGSWQEGPQQPADLQTAWYELPPATPDTPLLTVSVFGDIQHHDINGTEQPGHTLHLEYGTRTPDGHVTDTGSVEMLDVGKSPQWRNLRYPIADLPDTANVVRITAFDHDLDPEEWLAVTPPRAPHLIPLSDALTPDTPGLIDWTVGLQFPCQRPFDHYAGVAEIPHYRIAPDAPGKDALTPVQSYSGGGPMGLVEAVNTSYQMPTYLKDDWGRDWGSLEIYEPRTDTDHPAPATATIDHRQVTRSGLWNPSEIFIDPDAH